MFVVVLGGELEEGLFWGERQQGVCGGGVGRCGAVRCGVMRCGGAVWRLRQRAIALLLVRVSVRHCGRKVVVCGRRVRLCRTP